MRPSDIVLANHPLLQITLLAARAILSDTPEIKNYCTKSGECSAQNFDEQKACTFFCKPFLWICCTTLSDSGHCGNAKALISARR